MSDVNDLFDKRRDEFMNGTQEERIRLITDAIRSMCNASFSAGANAALDALTEAKK